MSYRYREHLIIFGMPELRFRTGRWSGPLTVPVMVQGKKVLLDSWGIARHADEAGTGAKLFTEADLARIEKYNALSEKSLDAVRILLTSRILQDPEAKREVLPSFLGGPLRPLFSWLATLGTNYVRREFGYTQEDQNRAEGNAHEIWAELARDLQASGGEYLIGGRLTYADIAMAVTLQGVEPTQAGPKLGPAYSRCWSTPSMQSEFRGLLEWRDRLYARHRARRTNPAGVTH